MTLKKLAGTAAACAIAAFAAGMLSAAVALPLPLVSGESGNTRAAAPVELAHGCHSGIQRDYSGWHFHTRACQRQNTPPPGLYDGPSYRRFYRGPVCSYQCRFIGPVKTCQQVCR